MWVSGGSNQCFQGDTSQREGCYHMDCNDGSLRGTQTDRGGFKLFREMGEMGVKSVDITFTVLLNGCSHSGLPDRAFGFYQVHGE